MAGLQGVTLMYEAVIKRCHLSTAFNHVHSIQPCPQRSTMLLGHSVPTNQTSKEEPFFIGF
eukprot:422905-Pelagomonas_calceolata.AAC.6